MYILSFKVWHYSGALLHETLWPTGQELLEVVWQKYPPGVCKEKPISTVKIEGIKSSEPQASSVPYRPPNARGIFITPKILPPTTNSTSETAGAGRGKRNTRRRDFKKRDQDNNGSQSTPELLNSSGGNGGSSGGFNGGGGGGNSEYNSNNRRFSKPIKHLPDPDPEKTKRIKALVKKLNDIAKLKSRKEKGEHIEANQLSKINTEADLIKELSELKVTKNV